MLRTGFNLIGWKPLLSTVSCSQGQLLRKEKVRNSKSHHGVQRGVVDEGAGVEGAVG